jgi:hypothetical protein
MAQLNHKEGETLCCRETKSEGRGERDEIRKLRKGGNTQSKGNSQNELHLL